MAGASLIGAAGQLAMTPVNQYVAGTIAAEDRRENYYYGELSAQNADTRTRALYSDFYSPEALARQYKKAGLSPGMMFGGTPGQGGMSGAQGSGGAGLQTPFMPYSMVEAAQAAALFAQADKTKAETENINKDTANKELLNQWQNMVNKEKSVDFRLATSYLVNQETGEKTSLFELANTCNDYEDFMKQARERAENSDKELYAMMATEQGQQTMRRVYMESNRFDRDIRVLSEEGVNADFQKAIMTKLSEAGFAEQNAKTTLEQLSAMEETAKLTKSQQSAWNDLIERLKRKNSTAADIIIVLGMILNQAATSWVSTNVKVGGKQ